MDPEKNGGCLLTKINIDHVTLGAPYRQSPRPRVVLPARGPWPRGVTLHPPPPPQPQCLAERYNVSGGIRYLKLNLET